jgi:hypothetical protein
MEKHRHFAPRQSMARAVELVIFLVGAPLSNTITSASRLLFGSGRRGGCYSPSVCSDAWCLMDSTRQEGIHWRNAHICTCQNNRRSAHPNMFASPAALLK